MPKFEREGAFDSIVGLLSADILGASSRELDTYSAFSKNLCLINDTPFVLEFFGGFYSHEFSEFLAMIEIMSGNYIPPE